MVAMEIQMPMFDGLIILFMTCEDVRSEDEIF